MSSPSSLPTSPNGPQLTVVAFLRAKPGLAEELGRRLHALVEPTRLEPGNIDYDLHRSHDDPQLWMFYENWRSAADLETHFQTPHLQAFIAGSSEVLDGELDIRKLSMVTIAERSQPAS